MSDTHLPVSYRLTAKRPIDMIYPILSKYQSSALPNELRFERSIGDIDATMKPYVQLNIDFYQDIASEAVVEESERRTIEDIETLNTNDEAIKSQIHQQLSYTYPYQRRCR